MFHSSKFTGNCLLLCLLCIWGNGASPSRFFPLVFLISFLLNVSGALFHQFVPSLCVIFNLIVFTPSFLLTCTHALVSLLFSYNKQTKTIFSCWLCWALYLFFCAILNFSGLYTCCLTVWLWSHYILLPLFSYNWNYIQAGVPNLVFSHKSSRFS